MAGGVRDELNINRFNLDVCELCGQKDNLKVCARCRSVSYCCKDHQTKHWQTHKVICKEIAMNRGPPYLPSAKTDYTKMGQCDVRRGVKVNPVIEGVDKLSIFSCRGNGTSASELRVKSGQKAAQLYNTDHRPCFDDSVSQSGVHDQYGVAYGGGSNILEELSNLDAITETSNNTNSHRVIPKSHSFTQELYCGSSENYILESEDSNLTVPTFGIESTEDSRLTLPTSGKDNTSNMPTLSNKETYFNVLQSRITALSQYVVKCLNAYGVCVIDNFLGEAKGTEILDEVKDLQAGGALSSGQLVNAESPNAAIRGDMITWIDGSEYGCTNINVLISSIDAIVIQCQRTLGKLISGRTKAMVAVYPGHSARFLRHVDNPNGDGRIVTCIYYLNKNWNSKTDGGLLRIFPEGSNKVANVEPQFDRLLFFWSDRRNPHEVMPTFKSRYAITVWYYDQEERKRAVKRYKGDRSEPKRQMVPLISTAEPT